MYFFPLFSSATICKTILLVFLNSNMFSKCLNFPFLNSNFCRVFGRLTGRAMVPVVL